MVKYVKGNLLDSGCDYICHQVNCQGVMNSGIAKQIRERWPEVYAFYRDRWEKTYHAGQAGGLYATDIMLGSIDIVALHDNTGRQVINMYSQARYGYDGSRFTSYDAFAKALEKIRMSTSYNDTIGFPKNIGCGLGGGNWKVISALIEEILGDYRDVYIYEYDPKED